MIGRFWGPTLDCPDPVALAEFYQRIGGGTIAVSTEEFAELRLGTASLGFQRDPAYRPPTWPTGDIPQQCHLDFSAADLDDAQAAALAAGARLASVQPHPAVFRVLHDPAGHPFCLTTWDTPAGPPESLRP